MSNVLVDTNILIDYFRARPPAVAYLDALRRTDGIATHVAVLAEVLTGVRDKQELRAVDQLMANVRLVNAGGEDLLSGVDLLRRYGLSHGLGWLDAVIGSRKRTRRTAPSPPRQRPSPPDPARISKLSSRTG